MIQVLVVDDSAVIVNEVSSFLKSHDIDSLMASNGQEGLDILTEQKDIPLAIVDINMPIMDGLTMIERIRRDVPDCSTKFIMLTTEFDKKIKERGKSLGVKGWMIKPFKGDAAIGAIQRLLAQ